MIHHGFQYKEGLNTDVNEFDSYPICRGGLFFSDEQNILRFCDYGDKIAIVTIPDGEQVVPVDTKYKAHSIILSEIRDLWTVKTFEWLVSLGINIHADGARYFLREYNKLPECPELPKASQRTLADLRNLMATYAVVSAA